MLLLGTRNFSTQTVLADGIINIGSVYRKFCKRTKCGMPTFSVTSNGISLQDDGIYHVTATLVGSGSAAGDLSVQLYVNGVPVDGAISTQTITTADTEIRTFVIDTYVKVDSGCVLGIQSTDIQTISLVNVSEDIDATFTSVVLNVSKEV